MTTTGKQARNKGIEFERFLVRKFRQAGFLQAKRHMESQEAEAQGFDIDNLGPLRVQAKRHKEYAPISTLFDVVKAPESVPVLITKPDEGPAVACLLLSDFLRILASAKQEDLPAVTTEDFL
jgi:hypothetical protein